MASRTRGSEMPRARSWELTMSCRAVVESGMGCGFRLFLATADAQVEADNAVLVTGANDGNVAIEIVLPLNNLLRTLRNIGGVGERYVVGEALLDGDLGAAGSGISFGAQSLRIDFDVAGAKQTLEAVAVGVVQCLVEDKGAGLVGKHALAGLLLELCRLFVRPAESEQGDDVRFRKWGFGTIVEVEAVVRRAGESDVQVIVADVRAGLKIELRLDGNGIGESDVSALKREAGTVEGGLAF